MTRTAECLIMPLLEHLNDMTRNGDVTNFTAPSTFTFGALAVPKI